ncbi:ribosomal protein L13 [Alkaliphilus metalliredigens QYMF]|uniref:Large ribosomal subunit protein uL13 n=1 Tax=Alkaliphilus metalliredigens (strain QYMF) TaxID=293826 RepID=RL13_ALKMQ|nr:50S ribosomal protein L13 [Alkaliphilus metalliredigens]A6TWE7.1 RecName: Full=Large ribosomal subunit protein uL13; AltName: Full=50S ribosomal protein L13 [Alkaliphilus metalliredigens QYMF]ABR50515.1 ribosomal protein L13 [Alkaliphilus metalliredigens QYMF]
MKSYMAKTNEVERKWFIVDAEGKTLGRLSSEIAKILTGKNKPEYTPHVDTGDFVIVVNAEKVVLTGKKLDQESYTYHTGHPGGLKQISFRRMLAEKPELLTYHAVKGMIPKTRLGRQMLKKLKVYAGENHDHEAQQPQALEL